MSLSNAVRTNALMEDETQVPFRLNLVEKLFLASMMDLRQRLGSHEGYDFIMASGIIRKLLLDGSCVADLANRRVHMKLTYPVVDTPPRKNDGLVFAGFNFKKRGNRDQFWRSPLVSFDDETYSAYEIITTCANSFGGIHGGEIPQGRLRKLISVEFASMGFAIERGGASNPLLLGVWSVGQGTLSALDPLYDHLAQFGKRRRPWLDWISLRIFGVSWETLNRMTPVDGPPPPILWPWKRRRGKHDAKR